MHNMKNLRKCFTKTGVVLFYHLRSRNKTENLPLKEKTKKNYLEELVQLQGGH